MALGISILGSTGSIGRSALAVLARHREQFRVVALAAHHNEAVLHRQVAEWRPDLAVLVEEPAGGADPSLRRGPEALLDWHRILITAAAALRQVPAGAASADVSETESEEQVE